jgi:hypothetical protein
VGSTRRLRQIDETPAGVSSTVVDVMLSRSQYGDGASDACVREVHFDGEATLGSGTWGEGGAVGARDGPDDGQAKSVSVGVSDPLAAELLEGLEQMLDLVGVGSPVRCFLP